MIRKSRTPLDPIENKRLVENNKLSDPIYSVVWMPLAQCAQSENPTIEWSPSTLREGGPQAGAFRPGRGGDLTVAGDPAFDGDPRAETVEFEVWRGSGSLCGGYSGRNDVQPRDLSLLEGPVRHLDPAGSVQQLALVHQAWHRPGQGVG